MKRPGIRPLSACLVALGCLALGARDGAAQKHPPIARFTGMAVDASGAKPQNVGRIEIALERWSSDASAARLENAIASGPEAMLMTIKTVGQAAGVLMSPGIQGAGARARLRRNHAVLFARESSAPDGRRVVLATDEHLGFAEPGRDRARAEHNEFTLVDIRFGSDGRGVGKIGPASQVIYDRRAATFGLRDFDTLPVSLVDVVDAKR
jgi:hypothetical protein